jgi:hypothetical protein
MTCQRCNSSRVASFSAKCSDLSSYSIGDGKQTEPDYVPRDLGIGGGDYVEFRYCLDCGQMQGDFAIPFTSYETGTDPDE